MVLPTVSLLDGRYLLVEPLPSSDAGEVWRAEDQVLRRSVAVRFAPAAVAGENGGIDQFQAEARRAAGLVHAGITQVYDFAPGDAEAGVPPYVVLELVEGERLADLLARRGALPPDEVWSVLGQLAAGLAVVHDAGLVHGALRADTVVVCGDGRVKLGELSAHAGTAGAPGRAEDFHALGLLAYHCLTGHAAAPDAAELPVQAGPQQLRSLVAALLDPDPARRPGNGQAIARAAARHRRGAAPARTAAISGPAPPPRSVTASPPAARRSRRRLAPALALALVGAVGVAVAAGGYVTSQPASHPVRASANRPAPARGGRSAGPAAPVRAASLHPLAVHSVQLFHPGGSGLDDPQGVGNVVDGNPGTAWLTQYYATPRFGNLRPGVGLLFDLGPGATVHTLHLRLAVPGVTFGVYAASNPAAMLSGRPLAVVSDAPADTGVKVPPTHARYWVVWFTRLAPYSGGYGAGVSEVSFTGT